MDPRDLNFPLRSGIGDGRMPIDPNNQLTVMALTSAFMEKAYGDAAKYARYLEQEEVTDEHVILALKYNAMMNTQLLTSPQAVAQISLWRDRLTTRMMMADIQDMSEEEAACTLQRWWRSIMYRPSDDDIRTIAEYMHSANEYWETWEPVTEMDRIFHNAVLRAMESVA